MDTAHRVWPRLLATVVAIAMVAGCSHHAHAGQPGNGIISQGPAASASYPPVPPGTLVVLQDRYAYTPTHGQGTGYQEDGNTASVEIAQGTTILVELGNSWASPKSSSPVVLITGTASKSGDLTITTFRAAAPGNAKITAEWTPSCNNNTRACPNTRTLTVNVS